MKAARSGYNGPMIESPAAYELRIDLDDLMDIETLERRKLWFNLVVDADLLLGELARLILTGFEWDEDHLYGFEVGDRVLAPPEFEIEEAETSDVELRSLITKPRMKFRFLYDFGTRNWHTIRVRHILKKPPAGLSLPTCVESGCSWSEPVSVAYINKLIAENQPYTRGSLSG